jgi:DNA-binding transcriptional LysR family regulator
MANYVSDLYARKHGVPKTLADLDRHFVVHYSQSLSGEPAFEWAVRGKVELRPMRALVTVNNTDAYEAACRAGLGIIQAPKWRRRDELVEILPEHTCRPMPVSLLHAHGTNVPKRVRAVMTWLEHVLTEVL